MPKSSPFDEYEHKRAVLGHKESTWKCGLRQRRGVAARPLDPNKGIRSCSIWKTIVFKPKDGCTGCSSWKVDQMVVVGVYKVKNNMKINKEDSIVHGCALRRGRDTLSCSELKRAAQLALVHWRFANQLSAYHHLLYRIVYTCTKNCSGMLQNHCV